MISVWVFSKLLHIWKCSDEATRDDWEQGAQDEGTALRQEHDLTDFAQGVWRGASPL